MRLWGGARGLLEEEKASRERERIGVTMKGRLLMKCLGRRLNIAKRSYLGRRSYFDRSKKGGNLFLP